MGDEADAYDFDLDERDIESEVAENYDLGFWETKDGDLLEIGEMGDRHLANTIRWLEKNPDFPCQAGYLRKMRREQRLRKLDAQEEIAELSYGCDRYGKIPK